MHLMHSLDEKKLILLSWLVETSLSITAIVMIRHGNPMSAIEREEAKT